MENLGVYALHGVALFVNRVDFGGRQQRCLIEGIFGIFGAGAQKVFLHLSAPSFYNCKQKKTSTPINCQSLCVSHYAAVLG